MKLSFKNLILNSNFTETETVKISTGRGIKPKYWKNILRKNDRTIDENGPVYAALDLSHSYSEFNSILFDYSECECVTDYMRLVEGHTYYIFYYTFGNVNSNHSIQLRNDGAILNSYEFVKNLPNWRRNSIIFKSNSDCL